MVRPIVSSEGNFEEVYPKVCKNGGKMVNITQNYFMCGDTRSNKESNCTTEEATN